MKTATLFTLLFIAFIFVSTLVKAKDINATCTPGGKGSNSCGPHQQCVMGSRSKEYRCICEPGHKTIGQSCEDFDECKDDSVRMSCARKGAICQNTDGSFKCECRGGFQMHPSNHICEDVNECEEFAYCHEKAKCHNTRGSFRCTCNEGFAGDGEECVEDIAYKQEKNKQLVLMIGGAAGGGILSIIALIAFCCCTRKSKKKEEKEETIEEMDPTLGHFGHEWYSSEDSDDDSD